MKKNNGITLIALVITIVVLIILASVAITLSLGDNGIFRKAAKAKEDTLTAQNEESMQLADYDNEIDEITGQSREGNKYVELDDETKTILNLSNQKYKISLLDLFNNTEYSNKISESQSATDYIINNQAILDKAILSNYMMNTLLNENNKEVVSNKLEEKCTTIPRLTSSVNGTDGGVAFGTAPFPYYGYQLWYAFSESHEYAYSGIGGFELGYNYSEPIWIFKISFMQRASGLEGIDNIVVQYSDNKSTWINATNTITTIRNTDEQSYIVNNAIGKHKYWRITGNGYGSNGGIRNLQFYGIK